MAKDKPRYGINIYNLKSFNSVLPDAPKHNREAMILAILGIEVAEFPYHEIGFSPALQEKMHDADNVALYIGMGAAKRMQHASPRFEGLAQMLQNQSSKKESENPELEEICEPIRFEHLINLEPKEIVSRLVRFGYGYNAIRIMRRNGFRGSSKNSYRFDKIFKDMPKKDQDSLYPVIDNAMSVEVNPRFWNRNIYANEPFIQSVKNMRDHDPVQYFANLAMDAMMQKNGALNIWEIDGYKARRFKFIATDRTTDKIPHYVTWAINHDKGSVYICNCPTNPNMAECHHIGKARNIILQGE